MVADKMRVHILAKELSVPSKTIIEKCNAEGISSVKNHMSTLSAGLHATISEWFSEGSADTAVETAGKVDLDKVRIKPRKARRTQEAAGEAESKPAEVEAVSDDGSDVVVAVAEAPEESATIAASQQPPTTADADAPSIVGAPEPGDGRVVQTTVAAEAQKPSPAAPGAAVIEAPQPGVAAETVGEPAGIAPAAVEGEVPPVVGDVEAAGAKMEAPAAAARPVIPAGPQNVPEKAKLQGPRVVRYEAPEHERPPFRRPPPRRTTGPATDAPASPGAQTSTDPARKAVDRTSGRRKGRASARQTAGRLADSGQRLAEWRDRDLAERRERLAGATGRRIRRRASSGGAAGVHPADAGPITVATVHEPVRMKEFCSETGLNFMQCFKVLKEEHGTLANVNMTLPTDSAELLALHFGIELTVIRAKTLLDRVKEEFESREQVNTKPRPPVVTMLGHVDHGKTSLLDAIRKTRVVSGEDGGITQHIGAYHLESADGAVTFLDTPGHEAFTAMRARGAELTDVVVLVVAADDGIMPQTVEAINHAKAAEVPIVVALNKIDLGDDKRIKIYGQLSEHGLTPSGEWGGEVDVISTSATTGEGVDELVGHLSDLSGLLDLEADIGVPARGAVIEAETKPGVGAVVRVLVQCGTLRVGDFVVCGPAFGKVRALLDDRGKRIEEAGPSLPVEVWGLDDVPTAGDMLFAVENLQRAKDIAEETKHSRVTRARIQSRKVLSLEEMFKQRDTDEIPELNVIIKGDVDGSLVALRHALKGIPSDEVRLSIRHSGVGAVNDSDVLLAAACRGIIIAFRVETPVAVRRLSEQHGVDSRSYRVIYDVCDDIKKALEGLLAPERKIETRASLDVRELFRLSKKAGVIAGSIVTSGVVERKHRAKVIRDGVVVREGCKFASIRRFKDDVKEVRAGLECGIRLESFDDVHVGDVIESYEIIEIARTL